MKQKRRKLKSLGSLKKKLWKVFSEWIRKRDGYKCISCGKQLTKATSQAGHFFPRTTGMALYFDETNVNCQCLPCNVFLHGNIYAYGLALKQKYGPTILEELDAKRRKVKKYTRAEYEELIKKYSAVYTREEEN